MPLLPTPAGFLQAIDPVAKNHLFALFPKPKQQQHSHVRATVSIETLESLARYNQAGSNIFVTVNDTGASLSRTKKEVIRRRAIFADDDGKKAAKPYPLPPSMIIETSPGKKQVWWLMREDIDEDTWDGIQQTIVDDYGGDPNARDTARILRVPGFMNMKPDYTDHPPVEITLWHPERRYSGQEIITAFPPSTVTKPDGREAGEALDLRAAMEAFISGANYHQAGISLAGWYFNKGISGRDSLIDVLQSQMDISGDVTDPRFDHRRNKDIPASVDWVLKKRKEEEASKIAIAPQFTTPTKADEYTNLPMPSGGMYQVVEWVKSIMRYPNDTIAIIVAEHLVSVFGGGHYQIEGNTTTRKRIMLAPLGSGKNTINRALGHIIKALISLNNEGIPRVLEAENFIGSDSFSFSVQHKQIEEHRVRSFIVNEAGEGGKSRAGDIDNLRAYQLQALSTKSDEVYIPKKYSEQGKNDSEKQMQNVYGGVWVYLHESTIKSYASLLRNSEAFVNGDLSRSDIFFINPMIIGKNRDHSKTQIPEKILTLFATLANDFTRLHGGKGSEEHDVWEEIDYTAIESDLEVLEDGIIKARNTAIGDEIKIAMLARRYERILTSILICATADAVIADGEMRRPVATKTHLDYAMKRAEAIDKTILFHANSGGALSNSQFDQVERQFIDRFTKIIKDKRKARNGYGMKTGTLGDGGGEAWLLSKRGYTEALKNGAAHALREAVYRGDNKRADAAIIDHLIGMELIAPVFVKDKNGDSKPKPNSWWMNRALFPIPRR